MNPPNRTLSCAFINDFGKAYKYRAIELIKISRQFSTGWHRSPNLDVKLQSVLKACDKALEHAVNSHKKELEPTNEEFDNAMRKLYEYEVALHHEKDPTVPIESIKKRVNVDSRMNDAKKRDKKNRRREWINEKDKTLRPVEFRILQSPSDDTESTTAIHWLFGTAKVPDILWIFSHYALNKPGVPREKWLTLAQNPHFYDHPPIFPNKSVDTFNTQPTEGYPADIYVLTENDHLRPRVFLKLGKKWRTFDNVWNTNNILIFKDIEGYLEGDAIVRTWITGHRLSWSRMVYEDFRAKVVGDTEDIEDIENWRAPIFELWNNPFIRIIKIEIHMALDRPGRQE